MRGTAVLLVFSIVGLSLGIVSSARAADNGPIGTPSAADLAQLKALGLDPKDPNLRTKFTALAAQRNSDLLKKLKGQSTKAKVTPETTTPRAFDMSAALAALKISGSLVKNPSPRNDYPIIDHISSVEGTVETATVNTTDHFGRVKFKAGDTFYISGTNLVGSNGAPKVTGDFGNCGTLSMPTTYVGSFTPVGSTKPLDILQVNVPAFNVDERLKDGALTLSTSGGYFTIKHVGYLSALEHVVGIVEIGGGGPAIGPVQSHVYSSTPFLGMIEGQTADTSQGGDRRSDWPGWLGGSGGSGIDEIGEGIKLEHGWSAYVTLTTNKIVDDEFYEGSASIQPGLPAVTLTDSLQLFVNWSFSADQYSAYQVIYDLYGPIGGVPLSNMPQQTDCSPVNFN